MTETKAKTVCTRIDSSGLDAVNAELEELSGRLSTQARKQIASALDLVAEKPEQLIVCEINGVTASGTPHGVIFLQPSALFREVLATVRAAAGEGH